jgi:prevent-host-death family protein
VSQGQEVGIEEARRDLGRLVSRVEFGGEHITITRRGRRVARIVPVTDDQADTTED